MNIPINVVTGKLLRAEERKDGSTTIILNIAAKSISQISPEFVVGDVYYMVFTKTPWQDPERDADGVIGYVTKGEHGTRSSSRYVKDRLGKSLESLSETNQGGGKGLGLWRPSPELYQTFKAFGEQGGSEGASGNSGEHAKGNV